MTGWLKRWFGKPDVAQKDDTVVLIRTCQKEEDEQYLADGTCPDCLTKLSMRLGPAGCSANNCMCIACRHEWNLFLLNGVTILDDMGRATEERARQIYGWEQDTATPKRIDA